MELAIPAFALGAMYVINNQSKKKESFGNNSQLPNVDIPNRNYPSEYPIVSSENDQTSELSTNNRFDSAGGVYTDKYFNPNMANQNNDIDVPYYSLTGNRVGSDYFQHNNMVPFFGSNSRSQNTSANVHEGILDNYSGAGSQSIIKKEIAPLFAPSDNIQWGFGTPNQSDFIQSRINPSLRMANTKPFAEESVAPGLGLGYTTQGSGGFNSGMMMREAWKDKNVDELRVDNKPKPGGYSLYGHEGPANSFIKNFATSEQMGIMERHLPEKTFEMGQERYFTTTGASKGETLRSIPIERFVSRPETSVSYAGAAGYQNSSNYIPGEYMPSHNQQLGNIPLGIANAQGRNLANESDYGIKSKMAYPNNRSVNKQDPYYGLVSGGLGAAVAPLLDILRPSRKENVIGTLRPYQNPGTTVSQSYIFNPADRPATTIRETTENSKFHLNVNSNQLGGAYQVTDQQPSHTYRQETGDFYYSGVASASAGTRELTSYDAGYNQRNNDIKSSTIKGYMVQGNMSLMNGDVNMRQVSRDEYLKNNRPVSGTMPYLSPDASTMGSASGSVNSLYSNIQLDRNTPEIVDMLKSNPYVVDYKNAL
jgi:hypothetical protein